MSRSDDDAQPSEAEKTEAETTEESGTTGQTGRPNKGVIAGVAAVVVLVVAGVVVYLLTSGDDTTDDATQGGDVPSITGSPAPTTPDPSEPGGSVAPPATATGAATGAPEDTDEAATLAEQAAEAISGTDVVALNELACDQSNPATEETFPADAKARVVGEPKITGDTATVDLELTIGDSEPAVVPMPLTKQDGRWCIPS
ncbi:hypothetical protein [Actinophytocola glycyrrhizae]|uniref:DUF4878 domain-containing protein n=1 Tax=Actinophytocola glycyrrhizae TaxID=2044873 RepID=A0ABV9RVX5_9PSEU